MWMDMCLHKFDTYQGTVASNCFKSHANSQCPYIISTGQSVVTLKKYVFRPVCKFCAC